MTKILDCEAVLERLTEAPEVGGRRSEEDLAEHVRWCHSCRMLVEELAPAVNCWQDHLANLPSDDSREATAQDELVIRLLRESQQLRAQQLPRERAPAPSGTWWGPSMALVLAVCLVAWLPQWGLVSRARDREDRSDLPGFSLGRRTQGESPSLAATCQRGTQIAGNWSVPRGSAHRISPEPMQGRAATGNAVPDDWVEQRLRDFACCLKCHRPGGPGPGTVRTVTALAAACTACHTKDTPSAAWTPLSLHRDGTSPRLLVWPDRLQLLSHVSALG